MLSPIQAYDTIIDVTEANTTRKICVKEGQIQANNFIKVDASVKGTEAGFALIIWEHHEIRHTIKQRIVSSGKSET